MSAVLLFIMLLMWELSGLFPEGVEVYVECQQMLNITKTGIFEGD